MARLVFPQALGKAAAKYFFWPLGLVMPRICWRQNSSLICPSCPPWWSVAQSRRVLRRPPKKRFPRSMSSGIKMKTLNNKASRSATGPPQWKSSREA